MLRPLLPSRRHTIRLDVSLAIVNIVLLLIFFFLATGSLLNSPGYNVDLSHTRDLPIDTLPRPILIVDDGGGLRLNGNTIAANQLGGALDGETTLHVLINKSAPAQDLLDLLAWPELAPFDIQLVTIHENGAAQ